MNKVEYLKLSLKNKRYLEKGWLQIVLGIMPKNTSEKVNTTFGIMVSNYRMYIKEPTIGGEWVEIDDYVEREPLYSIFEPVYLKAGDMGCIKEDIYTTCGAVIENALLIEYPYEGLLPYVNINISPGKWNDIAKNAIHMETVTAQMHIKFENAVSMLTCLSQLVVPAYTRKSIVANPLIKEHKQRLLEEHKDSLGDASVVAKIQSELMKLDEEYLAGDPSERFNIKAKSKISRLKLFGMVGAEPDYINENKINTITTSLNEGWKVEDIPILANNIRAGSGNRSINTALAGYSAKVVSRMFQNYKIVFTDCGTKIGVNRFITTLDTEPLPGDNVNLLEGRYLVSGEKITKEFIKDNLHKFIKIRSPSTCASKHTEVCNVCMGDIVSNSTIGLAAQMTVGISTFLGLFMMLMHGQTLVTEKFNYKERFQ